MSSWAEAKTKKKKVLSFGGNGMIGSEVRKFNNYTFILLINLFYCICVPIFQVMHMLAEEGGYDITMVSRETWHFDAAER